MLGGYRDPPRWRRNSLDSERDPVALGAHPPVMDDPRGRDAGDAAARRSICAETCELGQR